MNDQECGIIYRMIEGEMVANIIQATNMIMIYGGLLIAMLLCIVGYLSYKLFKKGN